MKFLRHLLGITKLDKEKNQCIRQKTGAQNTVQEINQYQKKWLQHVQRMDTNRLPKQALQYKPKGRRNIGRPRKRWREQLHLEDQGTGNTPNPSGTWWWWWWWWWWLRDPKSLQTVLEECKIHEFVYIRIYVTVLVLKVKNYLRWWYIKPVVYNTGFIYHHLK